MYADQSEDVRRGSVLPGGSGRRDGPVPALAVHGAGLLLPPARGLPHGAGGTAALSSYY